MRTLLIERLKEIKQSHGFSKASMRWEHVKLNGVHISDLDLDNLDHISDIDLLALFEKVIRRYYSQM